MNIPRKLNKDNLINISLGVVLVVCRLYRFSLILLLFAYQVADLLKLELIVSEFPIKLLVRRFKKLSPQSVKTVPNLLFLIVAQLRHAP